MAAHCISISCVCVISERTAHRYDIEAFERAVFEKKCAATAKTNAYREAGRIAVPRTTSDDVDGSADAAAAATATTHEFDEDPEFMSGATHSSSHTHTHTHTHTQT